MIRFYAVLFFLGALPLFYVFEKPEETNLVEEDHRIYCEERTYLGMRVYDKVKEGFELHEINIYWDDPFLSYEVLVFRKKWEFLLKKEIEELILEGLLSMRVQESIYNRCLKNNQQPKKGLIYAANG